MYARNIQVPQIHTNSNPSNIFILAHRWDNLFQFHNRDNNNYFEHFIQLLVHLFLVLTV